jgi:hypothetical protein
MGRGISWKCLTGRLVKILCIILYTIFRVSRNVRNGFEGLSVALLSLPCNTIAAKGLIFSRLVIIVTCATVTDVFVKTNSQFKSEIEATAFCISAMEVALLIIIPDLSSKKYVGKAEME